VPSSAAPPEPRPTLADRLPAVGDLSRRTVVVAGAILALLVAALAVALAGGGGDDAPPATGATRLVPSDTLVYLHLSTDAARSGTARAKALADRFPGYEPARRSLLKRLSAPGCPVDTKALSDGREAALALVDIGGGDAGSLVLLDTGSDKPVADRNCGTIHTAKLGRFLVIGQDQTIAMARKLAAGKGKPLAENADYRRELAKLPAGRVADAWVSQGGVQRLLAPQGGLLGAAGTLLNQPGLKATAAALTAGKGGARLVVRSLRDPKAGSSGSFAPFTPTIQDSVPSDAFAFLGLSSISGAAGRLLGLAGGQTAQLAPLLTRASVELSPLLSLFKGQVGVTITSAIPAPVLTLVTKTTDPAKARTALAGAQSTIANLLRPASGRVPQWMRVGDGYRLRPTAGIELDYAVVHDLIVVSTRASGIAAVRDSKKSLPETDLWQQAAPDTEKPVTSLVFLDFNQLLRLGEQTGLNDSSAYLAVKDDLQKLKSVSSRSSSTGDESTVELFLSIP
jgi:hypothetical protein